jgi:hypothetical protein
VSYQVSHPYKTGKNVDTYKACPSESGTDKFMQRFI